MLSLGQGLAKANHCFGKNGGALQRAPSSPCQVHLLHQGEKAGLMHVPGHPVQPPASSGGY